MAKEQATSPSTISGPHIQIDEVNKRVIITLPLETPRASGSGKNMTIATTGGNMSTTGVMMNNKLVKFGANVFIAKD